MKVGMDVSNFMFGLTNGTPIYLFNLVRALLSEYPDLELVLLFHARNTAAAQGILRDLSGPRVQVVRPGLVRTGVPRGGWWMPWHPRVSRMVGRIDVFHAGDYLRPKPDGTPTVVTVHDLTTLRHPREHFWANRLRDRWKLRWAASATHRIIAVSEATRSDLVELLRVDPDRIDVVPEARGQDTSTMDADVVASILARYGLDGPFVLMVGTLEPRKNHRRMITAFERATVRWPDVRLVLVGGVGWKTGPIDAAIRESPARRRILRLGFVPDDVLRSLYRAATIVAYPSLYEGFGLPVLEAMAAGAPVLTSNRSSLPEVAGEAAILVDPESVDEMTRGLTELLASPKLRERLSVAGIQREKTFTWARTARLTMDSYRRALEACNGGSRDAARSG
jgi:glycosyltransferase involved in cell wall biosynthesis